jgi:mannose-6-phosphate isomerase-like protein (cupin superfamily)
MTLTHQAVVPFRDDIVARAKRNPFFREVVSTGPHAQVVVMSIPQAGEIGAEVHADVDQILVIVDDEGVAVLEGARNPVAVGHLVHVPAGRLHNIVNTGRADLKLFKV